jgi:hypothetical protein
MSADYLLRFTITGNTESPAFHGLALAIIRAKDEAKVKCP